MAQLQFQIKIDENIKNLDKALRDAIEEAGDRSAHTILAQAIENLANYSELRTSGAGRDSLLTSGKVAKTGDLMWDIGFDAEHSQYIEEGTGIHGPRKRYIQAKHTTSKGTPGFLKFRDDGRIATKQAPIPGNVAFKRNGYIFTRFTRGFRPHPFLEPAPELAKHAIEQIFAEEMGRLEK